MSGRRAKKLRKALAGLPLAESKLMVNQKTGTVVRGPGRRQVYQKMKATPVVRAALERGVAVGVQMKPAKPEPKLNMKPMTVRERDLFGKQGVLTGPVS
jgi:hypothetical protein